MLMRPLALGLLIGLLAAAGCAHAPVPDPDVVNIYEKCRTRCWERGKKVAAAACEDAAHYQCFCEEDPT